MATHRENYELNKPVIERNYFVRVKFAEFNDNDLSSTYNQSNMGHDHPLHVDSASVALEHVYTVFAPENLENSWTRFEVYEEEVTVVRRLIHSADRAPKYLRLIRKAHAALETNHATKQEKKAQKEDSKQTTKVSLVKGIRHRLARRGS
jgi:hypothetical protein